MKRKNPDVGECQDSRNINDLTAQEILDSYPDPDGNISSDPYDSECGMRMSVAFHNLDTDISGSSQFRSTLTIDGITINQAQQL